MVDILLFCGNYKQKLAFIDNFMCFYLYYEMFRLTMKRVRLEICLLKYEIILVSRIQVPKL